MHQNLKVNQRGHISSKYDHINLKSWKGDVQVQNVVLDGSQSAGFRVAENELAEAQYYSPFDNMKNEGGYDILCPFGDGKMVLVNGHLLAGEQNETQEERDDTPVAVEPEPDEANPNGDVAGTAEPTESQTAQAPKAWISIDDNNLSNAKKVHKASILQMYSSPLTIADSKD